MHQATRVRFRGGDPLALTKRIQARRHSLSSEVRHYRAEQASPEPYRPTFADHARDAWTILWQAGLLIVGFLAIAWTGPIFAAVMGMGR